MNSVIIVIIILLTVITDVTMSELFRTIIMALNRASNDQEYRLHRLRAGKSSPCTARTACPPAKCLGLVLQLPPACLDVCLCYWRLRLSKSRGSRLTGDRSKGCSVLLSSSQQPILACKLSSARPFQEPFQRIQTTPCSSSVQRTASQGYDRVPSVSLVFLDSAAVPTMSPRISIGCAQGDQTQESSVR